MMSTTPTVTKMTAWAPFTKEEKKERTDALKVKAIKVAVLLIMITSMAIYLNVISVQTYIANLPVVDKAGSVLLTLGVIAFFITSALPSFLLLKQLSTIAEEHEYYDE